MNTIIEKNKEYWTHRADSYSSLNANELHSGQKEIWLSVLSSEIKKAFPEKKASEISVLEIGTGPGFIAITLAEAGYQVTATDLTPAMLEKAKENAGSCAASISFLEMNAEELSFAPESFDVIVSRCLIWALPHPETAYREMNRVLNPEGLMLAFDANWYLYLYDEKAKKGYLEDRNNTRRQNIFDRNIGENFDVMEEIAKQIPLSNTRRPEWDCAILSEIGLDVSADTNIYETVWSEEEKVNFLSTPLFMVRAVKKCV